ncbi:MAG: YraN family protein [Paludibacteraceae bacterium]
MAEHNKLGNEGEAQAVAYLRNQGYKILHTNWKCRQWELDIVAQNGEMLVVVEVKTRSTDIFEHPQEAITPKKIKNIVNATQEYILQSDWQGETRFDVVSVIPRGQSFAIEHIEDAFLAPIG